MKDLEIRGAGNLLGAEQSGYIATVGFDLYSRLLNEAVEEIKQGRTLEDGKKILHSSVPAVGLPLAAFLPEEYIPDLSTRLNFYQRLAVVKRAQEIDDVTWELSDRFGPPPEEVKNLLYVVEIKQLATEAMLESISTENRQVVLHFNHGIDLNKLFLANDVKSGIKVGSDRIKLDIKLLGNNWQAVLKEVLQKVVSTFMCMEQ
jgi:transcription-repair coupling factor (superfamily II helicase)